MSHKPKRKNKPVYYWTLKAKITYWVIYVSGVFILAIAPLPQPFRVFADYAFIGTIVGLSYAVCWDYWHYKPFV